MKKILVAALAAVAVATPAMAFEVTWKGDFNNRFMYSTQADLSALNALSNEATRYVNTTSVPGIDTRKNSKDSDFFGEVKYRMWLNATDDDKKVKGVVGLEFGGIKYGEPDGSGKGFKFGGDGRDVLELMHAYTEFEVPFDPSSRLTLGLQPVGLNSFVWSDNAAGVKWASKRDNLSYALAWFRNDVNNKGTGGDRKDEIDDAYAIDVTYELSKGNALNAFAIYTEYGQDDIAGVADAMDKELWVGLAGKGQMDNLFGGFTAIYLTGGIDGQGDFAPGAEVETSLDRKAYLVNLEGTAKLDKARVKLGWEYASGDDDPNDGDVENFDVIDQYTANLGSVVIFDSYADDNTTVTSPYILDKGLNTIYLHGDYDLNDKASVGLGYLWINTAEDLDGSDADTSGEKDLGHEIVARASYTIAKGLTAGIAAGYFIGGDAWDELASDGDGDDVFRTDASIRYKF